ncbi:GNAT family N-acetyltransferase [Brevibacillus gelatini]|uniref:GNAT family N-acetyltransferase n=1 Tax=Brevibacillus gelatini TaxID=1655277 RepID=UPI003D81BB1D
MAYKVYTQAERPDLNDQMADVLAASWSTFMLHDEVAEQHYDRLEEWFGSFQYLLTDENDTVMAVGNSIPFYWDGTLEGMPKGWDDVFLRGIEGYAQGQKPNTLSALSISIDPKHRGLGLSRQMVTAMKDIAKQNGLEYMVVPVRPSLKHKYPLIPMENYLEWKTADGAPFDPWVRTHWKMGGKIMKVAAESMLIRGSLAKWEEWTGMNFPGSGMYIIPGALVPVRVEAEKDEAVYVEPNVWMQHVL